MLWTGQRSEEAGLLQEYRAKLAAAQLCVPPAQLAAVIARLVQERQAALAALRTKHRAERQLAHEITKSRRVSPSHTPVARPAHCVRAAGGLIPML